ncbi:MAG: bifunctional phosphoribosylaminoimidazolecarboxamide formyltransferase/IMP cyclohydrolase [Alphaproteobacteria bacterium]|nr:bifunctional phosphoribosylaminoimidazolecarboxamide formyltransferase/IMP cyclohydrolase [Alphaproteobacteria bacterium]
MTSQPSAGVVPIARALISVSDKTGLVELAHALAARGIEILSTGGSAAALAKAGIDVSDVSAHTGFPEIMDGRVKTLHPKIHGGILARRGHDADLAAMETHDIAPIDLVVVNLYPFAATIAGDPSYGQAIENIDIGGPALIRAGAKNHAHVAVVTDPADYDELIQAMAVHDGGTDFAFRRALAAKAYGHTSTYDALINDWLSGQAGLAFPRHLTVAGTLARQLRYGENPHQEAALYLAGDGNAGVAGARQVQGKELSYNNLNDADAAWALAAEFEAPTVAIIKHANPCGVASATDIAAAYRAALACDPVSALGGVVAVNRPVDDALARAVTEIFTEVVVAPAADDAAIALFAVKKNLRLLLTGDASLPSAAAPRVRRVTQLAGGFLVQDADLDEPADLKVVTKRAPSPAELDDMAFAFTVAKHVKSNAIVYAKDLATVGIGAGQMARVDSARIAASKAAEAGEAAGAATAPTQGSVVASDAFFPFADGLMVAVEAGATAVIQPGGSARDDEVIAAADEAGIAMVFTGIRHFRH